jgi:fatty acid desaturase
MSSSNAAAADFSLAEARHLVRDLFVPNPWIYWVDFLVTISLGYAAGTLARLPYDLQMQPLAWRLAIQLCFFAVQCACYFRAVMFVHEIVHLPDRQLRVFRLVWNLLCGVPFLVPSFTYYTHLDHHRRQMFGTAEDGEYLPLASMSPVYILFYLSQCLWVPPLALIRFGILTPLMWFCPPLRRLIHQRASSLVMDPTYIRPLPTKEMLRLVWLQELGCFLVIWGMVVVARAFLNRWPIPLLVHAYLTAIVLIFLNSLRTLASHRWGSNGETMTFVGQMLDSVTLDSNALSVLLLNPVGLRYHAAHHLFPSMPYHNIRTAHQRLMAELPADSPYRATVARSVWSVVVDLVARARAAQSQKDTKQPLLAMEGSVEMSSDSSAA